MPEWAPGKQQVPSIAKDYWRLGDDATMLDLILAVRADEVRSALSCFLLRSHRSPCCPPAVLTLRSRVGINQAQHRFVNHSLANLKQDDLNPFAMKHAPPEVEGATDGFTREQSKQWIEQVSKELSVDVSAGQRQRMK